MDLLYLHMNSISRVSLETYEDFRTICEDKEYSNHHTLIEFGEVSNKMFFITEGITRTFYINSQGEEVNKSFGKKGELVASSESNFFKTPSQLSCQCLTNIKVIEANYDDIQKMCIKHKEIGYFQYKALQYNYANLEARIIDLLSYNTRERYIKFKEENPTIEFRIEPKHIASYLGISEQDLEDIKSSIIQNIL